MYRKLTALTGATVASSGCAKLEELLNLPGADSFLRSVAMVIVFVMVLIGLVSWLLRPKAGSSSGGTRWGGNPVDPKGTVPPADLAGWFGGGGAPKSGLDVGERGEIENHREAAGEKRDEANLNANQDAGALTESGTGPQHDGQPSGANAEEPSTPKITPAPEVIQRPVVAQDEDELREQFNSLTPDGAREFCETYQVQRLRHSEPNAPQARLLPCRQREEADVWLVMAPQALVYHVLPAPYLLRNCREFLKGESSRQRVKSLFDIEHRDAAQASLLTIALARPAGDAFVIDTRGTLQCDDPSRA